MPDKNDKSIIYLLNTENNPAAEINEDLADSAWDFVRLGKEWSPEQELPDKGNTSALIVFSNKYREDETYSFCKSIRQSRTMDHIPLLVGISLYQMPLGNNVKKMQNAGFIFTPLRENELRQAIDKNASGLGIGNTP